MIDALPSVPKFCFVETDTAGQTHVAVFKEGLTGAVDHYTIQNYTKRNAAIETAGSITDG
jgi:hypothetical protein